MKFLKIYYYAFILVVSSTLFILKVSDVSTYGSNVIVLDAGHGGIDGGTCGKNKTLEKTINLEIVLKLKKVFEKNGYVVILTRDGDYDLASKTSSNRKREDIHKRVDIINESSCLAFISIHCNEYSNSKVCGSQVFFSKKNDKCDSKILAKSIMESLRSNLNNTNRQEKEIENKYLLDNTNKPGVICEVGFLSNPNEEALLKTSTYQDEIAMAIYKGFENYISKTS